MDKPAEDFPQAVATVIRMTTAAKRMQAKDVYQAAGISKSVWDRSIQSTARSSALKLDQIAAIAGALGVSLTEIISQAEARVAEGSHRDARITQQESDEIDDVVNRMVRPRADGRGSRLDDAG